MKKQGLSAVILIFAWVFPGLVMAEDGSAPSLLQRMQQAYQQLNFELTLIEFSQGELEPKRLTRGHLDGQVFTHLTHLNGRPREFVQRGDETSFFDASHSGYTLKNSNLPGLFYRLQQMSLDSLLAKYDAVSAGRSRVLGRVAQVVRLVPKSADYYGYMLWLDQETGLLVRLDTLSEDAQVVEQSMGVALKVSDMPSPLIKELKAANLPALVSVSDVYPAPQQQLPWRFGWMPAGFELRSQDKHKLPITEQAVDYVMLSNSLVDVSVYLSQAKAQTEVKQQLVRQGATHLLSVISPAGADITVVGAIPVETARQIAESITRVETP
ncbi:MucB/RseB C-terminal domain-containing protein [Oceanisphaera sp. IT1-181]|uniref:MucB/RseB C-terminal domain-containing protein n=1 Tax=Oceanisphaera sp. IT1-181 TaxID=3081199 RepID=UPI0029CA0B5A|nr:MucB/RseB C-terminal domain-containing protein [Oceanisphaera sp. IT1-181]